MAAPVRTLGPGARASRNRVRRRFGTSRATGRGRFGRRRRRSPARPLGRGPEPVAKAIDFDARRPMVRERMAANALRLVGEHFGLGLQRQRVGRAGPRLDLVRRGRFGREQSRPVGTIGQGAPPVPFPLLADPRQPSALGKQDAEAAARRALRNPLDALGAVFLAARMVASQGLVVGAVHSEQAAAAAVVAQFRFHGGSLGRGPVR